MKLLATKKIGLISVLSSIIFSTIVFQNCGQPHVFQVKNLDSLTQQVYNAKIEISADAHTAVNSSNTAIGFTVLENFAGTVTCRVDNQEWQKCSSPFSISNISEGAHVFQVRAQNVSEMAVALASHAFIVDLKKPVVLLSTSPASPTSLRTFSFAFSGTDNLSGINYMCLLDASVFAACTSPVNVQDLPDGSHTFKVKAIDDAGNVSDIVSSTWVVNSMAPVINITSKPVNFEKVNSANFVFTATSSASQPVTTECKVGKGEFAPCTSPVNLTNLFEGSHSFSVRGVGSAGISSQPLAVNWIVDRVAPVLSMNSSVIITNRSSWQFTFAANDANGAPTYMCSFDSGNYSICTSPYLVQIPSDSNRSLNVRAVDAAGNVSNVITRTTPKFDSVLPTINLVSNASSNPSDFSYSSTPSDDNLPVTDIKCALDTIIFTSCASIGSYGLLSGGNHSFTMAVTDQAGNTATQTVNWTTRVIQTPPTPDPIFIYNNLVQSRPASRNAVGIDVRFDAAGNYYVAGKTSTDNGCNQTLCFVPAGSYDDNYLTKYNSAGVAQWTKTMGQVNQNAANSVSVAVDSWNNVYYAGNMPDRTTYPSAFSYFLNKYDSNGNQIFSIIMGQLGKSTRGARVTIDKANSVYISGYTTGNFASCNGVPENCTGAATGTNDYFITKYSSVGVWQWTRQLGQAGKSVGDAGLAADSSNNVYLYGSTTGNLASCSGVSANCTGASQGSADYFISKYSSEGVWQWTKQLGGTSYFMGAFGMTIDSNNNIIVSGNHIGNIANCNGVSGTCSGTVTTENKYYISKYAPSGDWIFTKQFSAPGYTTYGRGLAADVNGTFYMTGYTTANLESSGSSFGFVDYFIRKFDSSGNILGSTQLGQTNKLSSGLALATGPGNKIAVTGSTGANLASCNGMPGNCGPYLTGDTGEQFVGIYKILQ